MDKPILAICYDFDHTLTINDMQAQGFIQDLGFNVDEFWHESTNFCKSHKMDFISGYMYKMLVEAKKQNTPLTQAMLHSYGSKLKLFPQVESWFQRIEEFGNKAGVKIQHYIISSGLKEIILGTSIAKHFKEIYACSYLYNDKGEAIWPAQMVNYTNKTQYLFRIEKGYLDISDDRVNDYVSQENLAIPFRNIVYIGDSATDIPCMQLTNRRGGHSIGVYCENSNNKERILQMFREGRINYIAEADYSPNSSMENILKAIIEKTATYEKLHNFQEAAQKIAFTEIK